MWEVETTAFFKAEKKTVNSSGSIISTTDLIQQPKVDRKRILPREISHRLELRKNIIKRKTDKKQNALALRKKKLAIKGIWAHETA